LVRYALANSRGQSDRDRLFGVFRIAGPTRQGCAPRATSRMIWKSAFLSGSHLLSASWSAQCGSPTPAGRHRPPAAAAALPRARARRRPGRLAVGSRRGAPAPQWYPPKLELNLDSSRMKAGPADARRCDQRTVRDARRGAAPLSPPRHGRRRSGSLPCPPLRPACAVCRSPLPARPRNSTFPGCNADRPSLPA
jgi:hypothetical protein